MSKLNGSSSSGGTIPVLRSCALNGREHPVGEVSSERKARDLARRDLRQQSETYDMPLFILDGIRYSMITKRGIRRELRPRI